MKILVSNDDGIFAEGIRSLANGLAAVGHEVIVVCPDKERSATGHSLTLYQPIRAEIVKSIFDDRITAWACSGTPADCVKLALFGLLETPPDLVLAGINHGPNLGTDILYSGTVSAAMEGIVENIPSIALSLGSYTSREFEVAVNFAQSLVQKMESQPLDNLMLLNVNIPAVKETEIAGVKITRQGIRRYIDIFEKRVDPRGKTYYWLAGEVQEDVEDTNDQSSVEKLPTDIQAMREKYITITPLQYNLTYGKQLGYLQKWKIDNFRE
ncbi:MAG: 5'/3'-nucleotidase SurE [Okeania sp. SIO2F4]|uniref:5'/3'-nucleotidase SurE n=1 Tax=Okeania sp. SIO2F4 TaxID=2607790 RepID=UPI0014291C16|nr:5'/3'-nucleotidase SurE [Okeania sp. SIO2F4]NES07145.1 5'/3'-nucleotidase SurE [Okeania sp. SIO2F4]